MFRICLCVVGQQDYCKSNQPISFKLVVNTGPTNGKNRLTVGDDLVSDTDFGSLLLFPQRCILRYFGYL